MPDIQATLDAWREQGADRHNPLRFHFIDALARRATANEGEARRVMDARLSDAIDVRTVVPSVIPCQFSNSLAETCQPRAHERWSSKTRFRARF